MGRGWARARQKELEFQPAWRLLDAPQLQRCWEGGMVAAQGQQGQGGRPMGVCRDIGPHSALLPSFRSAWGRSLFFSAQKSPCGVGASSLRCPPELWPLSRPVGDWGLITSMDSAQDTEQAGQEGAEGISPSGLRTESLGRVYSHSAWVGGGAGP